MSPSCTRAKNGPPMSHPPRDGGFTLIELLVTMSLMGVMMAIAVSGWSSWAKSSEQAGTARGIQSVLRQTQQQAVTEGQSMCVLFDTSADTYTIYRGRCDGTKAQARGPLMTESPRVHLTSPSFESADAAGQPGVSFTPRGGAWPGNVQVTRDGSSKVYTLEVEGLTGRVELTD